MRITTNIIRSTCILRMPPCLAPVIIAPLERGQSSPVYEPYVRRTEIAQVEVLLPPGAPVAFAFCNTAQMQALEPQHRPYQRWKELFYCKSTNASLLASLVLKDDRLEDFYGLDKNLLQHFDWCQHEHELFRTDAATYMQWVLAAGAVNLSDSIADRAMTRFASHFERWSRLRETPSSEADGDEDQQEDEGNHNIDDDVDKESIAHEEYVCIALLARERERASPNRESNIAHPFFMLWNAHSQEAQDLAEKLVDERTFALQAQQQLSDTSFAFHVHNFSLLHRRCQMSPREYLLRVFYHSDGFRRIQIEGDSIHFQVTGSLALAALDLIARIDA
ncbi:hypothetical protein PUNSTDRAFT_136690 [Punctularia strigosozonata HHB-11173 SS5]|uniref:uncharacterized protein n=1 Tax=Punctularia strigosozonata (strain HHB-11173) TaxID=741275 RepID=UPI00044168EF|nr:uncharacterized protein PUNSTDRAFT_136690 [Punctularia strigosozonata HHB-11173 SS5]EIN06866.1 hypothetical protein PUNSTDRAFT_136690 [Punctularia strigosozonata HHB-11173 SS5]